MEVKSPQAPERVEAFQVDNKDDLQNRLNGGAGCYFWIAGLSLVNSVVMMAGGGWGFIVGLGITQVIDAFTHGLAEASGGGLIKIVGFMGDILVAAAFVIFGVFARRGQIWAFGLGMSLYALDGLLFLLVKDFLGLGFHAFALFCLYNGLKACQRLKTMEKVRLAAPINESSDITARIGQP